MQAIQVLIGVLFVLVGIYTMWQAHLPKEKRTVRFSGLHGPASPILMTGQCIRVGGIVAIMGASVALEGVSIHFGTLHVLVAVALAAILIVASAIVGDDV